MRFTIGISPCPNDTYIFGPLLEGHLDTDFKFHTIMDDVEVMNRMALKHGLDIIKVSYGVVPEILDNYAVLKAGGALGFGCGPLVVSKRFGSINQLKGKRIAIPGRNTSAFRFFKHFYGEDFEFVELRFDLIMTAVLTGSVDAGVIIHEGRFVYQSAGLLNLADLGAIWEKRYDMPIPLGAIVIKRELAEYAGTLKSLIQESISFSEKRYGEIEPFIKEHAQEMSDEVIKKHIDLYVNRFSYDMTEAVPGLTEFLDCTEEDFV
ncbi:1,4-dihydroxy-6-naphthoate synthase [Limisalsivibrio acetivorans]|uniref:1,4-dihydroxy-6-naphthoate synthase n=1 Tax=Limisalsivibrio acetivorans TaxID=1304888 RepID=UPI0003B3EA68|nr:1,4-dihydroxy-6-naphthoate synthase [Limisalsivibrio acetivorans]